MLEVIYMKKILRALIITLVFAFVSFYFTLPALNFRSPMFYSWLLEVAVVYVIASLIGVISVEDLRNRTVDFGFLKRNAKIGTIRPLSAMMPLSNFTTIWRHYTKTTSTPSRTISIINSNCLSI